MYRTGGVVSAEAHLGKVSFPPDALGLPGVGTRTEVRVVTQSGVKEGEILSKRRDDSGRDEPSGEQTSTSLPQGRPSVFQILLVLPVQVEVSVSHERTL